MPVMKSLKALVGVHAEQVNSFVDKDLVLSCALRRAVRPDAVVPEGWRAGKGLFEAHYTHFLGGG